MSTGNTSQLGLDASQYIAEIDKAAKYTQKYSQAMVEAAVTTLRFSKSGEIIDATVKGTTASGEELNLTLNKMKQGWEVTAASIGKSLATVRAEQKKLADDKSLEKANKNLAAFRQTTGSQIQRQVFPKGGKNTDYRSLFGDLDQLESYVRRGEVTAKRAQTIFTDVQAGTSKRITRNPAQEDFRQDALKLLADSDRLKAQLQKRVTTAAGRSLAADVPNRLDNQFGKLLPGVATPAQLNQVEAAYQRIQRAAASGGISSDRLNDLLSKSAKGVADPINLAERQVVSSLKRIDDAFASAQAKANKTAEKATNKTAALDIGSALKSGAIGSLGSLDPQNLERVYSQISKIQNLVANGKLTTSQYDHVFDAVQKGAKTNFQGAEETARASLTRIKGIISGEFKNPFEVPISFNQAFNGLKSLIAANYALRLVDMFKSATHEAAEFQVQIALIQTITQDANLSFNQWAQGIRAVSDELGKPLGEIAAAGYDLLSNQVTRAADTFDTLRVAGQFARITNSSTEDSVNLLSTAINTFRLNTSEAERVASEFFTVIDLGRVKAAGLANSGRTFEFGKTVGASIEEINASIITLTQSGIKEDNALTLLNNVYQKLLNPTKELQQLYDKLGVSTGETFVKTYGFAGALQKLKDATGGSSAKLADLFNEIRGFQGIDNLISRIDIFNDSLKQLDGSYERAAEAKKKFDDLPGQKYLQETNKVKNLFTTGFDTKLLEGVLAATDYFGGLDQAVIRTTQALVALGGGVAAVAVAIKVIEVSKAFDEAFAGAQLLNAGLTQTTFALNSVTSAASGVTKGLSIAFAAAAIGYTVQRILELKDEVDGTYETILKQQDDANKKLEEADQASRSKRLKVFEDDLNKRRQGMLEYVAEAKRDLSGKDLELDKIGKGQQAELKNSLELSLKSSKEALNALVNQQAAALKSIADLKKQQAHLEDERGNTLTGYRVNKNTIDTNRNERTTLRQRGAYLNRGDIYERYQASLFNHSLIADEANNGGAREGQIYQKRIDQLAKLQKRAAYTGDTEGFQKHSQEILQLTEHLASARDQDGNLKYYGQEQAIANVFARENQLITVQIALKKQLVDANEKQIKLASKQIETAEDAAKKLYEFSLTDKHTGKLLDPNKEAALKRYQGLKDDFDKANAAVNKNTNITHAQYREVDVQTSAKLKADRDKEIEEQFAKHYGTTSQTGHFKQGEIDNFRDKQSTGIDDQLRKSRDIEKSLTESTNELHNAQELAKTTSGTLFRREDNLKGGLGLSVDNENIHLGYTDTKESKQRDKLLDQYHGNLNAGLYGDAFKVIDKLEALFKSQGVLNKTYPGGPKDTDITVQQGLTQIRANTKRVQEADETDTQNRKSYESISGSSKINFAPIDDLFTKYGDVAARAKSLEGQKSAALSGMGFVEDLLAAGSQLAKNMASAGDEARQARQATLNAPESTVPAAGHSMGGDINYFDQGGGVSSSRGIDSVNAMLAPGEFVMNPHAAARFHAQLVAMNSGFDSGKSGGSQHTTSVGDIHVHVNGGNSTSQTIKEIAAGIQRELRRGTISIGV